MKRAILPLLLLSFPALAGEQIIRPYQSIRSSGMGGVRLTTGLYDENFFGNPARASQNPKIRVTILELVNLEASLNTIGNIGTVISGGDDVLSQLSDTAGTNNHMRLQTVFPAVYIPNMGGGKMSYGLGLLSSIQADLDLRQSFALDPTVISDIGPALLVARRFGDNNELTVGVTVNATYRLSSNTGFTLIDMVQGKSISPTQSGGEGAHVDGSIGAIYDLPVKLKEWDLQVAATVNNVADGRYSNLGVSLADLGRLPRGQPRAFGFGIAARKPSLGSLLDTTVAFEVSDIGNNPHGSLFRLLHIGAETRWRVILMRAGINQGYPTAGVGFDFRFFTIDTAYYAEEMSLNAGGRADHRVALKLAFQVQ
jgi:hypothetical protein